MYFFFNIRDKEYFTCEKNAGNIYYYSTCKVSFIILKCDSLLVCAYIYFG